MASSLRGKTFAEDRHAAERSVGVFTFNFARAADPGQSLLPTLFMTDDSIPGMQNPDGLAIPQPIIDFLLDRPSPLSAVMKVTRN